MTSFGSVDSSSDLEPDPPPDSDGHVDPLEHLLSNVLLWKDAHHPGRLALSRRKIICTAGLYYMSDSDINQLVYFHHGQSFSLPALHKFYLRIVHKLMLELWNAPYPPPSQTFLQITRDDFLLAALRHSKKTRPSDKAKVPRFPPSEKTCLLYTSPSPRDQRGSRMPSSA